MNRRDTVHAPYNFIPFAQSPWLPYESAKALPPHDEFDPKLLTGEIHLVLTAETPVCVSGGEREETAGGAEAHFFRGPNGRFAIPGSTIRGMTRENMQILSFAAQRPQEDLASYRLFYREIASASSSTAGPLKKYYRDALGVVTERAGGAGKTFSIPSKVRAGYISYKPDGYKIYPVQGGAYIRIPRREHLPCKDRSAQAIPVFYKAAAGRVSRLCEERWGGDAQEGMLVYTGKAPQGANACYLFPAKDESADPIRVSTEDVLSYKEDWEKRKNVLRPKEFWKLPEPGESAKPVFYVQEDGHTYFGMSLFLRIGYKHAIEEGLSQENRKLAGQEDGPLDFPSAILGFSRGKRSYRSRVSFGDFAACVGAQEMEPVKMILGEPKPGYYPGYLCPAPQDRTKNYNDDDFRLRGYKQYWLKAVEETDVAPDKDKVGTKLYPLPTGTRFCGAVRYRNLSKVELGLLLWSLCLDEDCRQNIGMGKPYGYGRMRVEVERIVEYAPEDLYGGQLCPVDRQLAGSGAQAWAREYIRAYEQAASKARGGAKQRPVRQVGAVRDFLYMKRAVQGGEEFAYMHLQEYRNTRKPLPSVQDIRSARTEEAQPAREQTMEEKLALFQAKFSKKRQRGSPK